MSAWPHVEAVPDAPEVLAALRPRSLLALATNAADSDQAEIRAALHRVGLDRLLDRVYCFRGVGHRKPSPEFFEYVLNDLRTEPSRAVMVGDNFHSDVLGANRAGIRAIWLNGLSAESRAGGMHNTIFSLRTLPQALEDLMVENPTRGFPRGS